MDLSWNTIRYFTRRKSRFLWDHDIDIAVWHDGDISKIKVINLMEKDNFFLREGFGIEDDSFPLIKKEVEQLTLVFSKEK